MNAIPSIDEVRDGEVIEQLTFLLNALADRQGAMDEDEAHGLSRMLGHIIQDLTVLSKKETARM